MNEYKVLMFFSLLLALISFNTVFASSNNENKKIIYIDPGHGGVDPGAIYKGIKEEDLTLKISLKLKEKLELDGYIVYLTRDSDYDLANKNSSLRKRSDLYNRSQIINKSNADLYLSIHLNAEDSGIWSGSQVFYNDINRENKLLAQSIQNSLAEKLKTRRKAMEISDGYLYKNVKVPGVLIEVGFLSNTNERYLLQQDYYQNKICEAIISGINNYFPNRKIFNL